MTDQLTQWLVEEQYAHDVEKDTQLKKESNLYLELTQTNNDNDKKIVFTENQREKPFKNNHQVDNQIIDKQQYVPKYTSKAYLNIYTSKSFINHLQRLIKESFQNESDLYYYIDISTAFQINDKQIHIFTFNLKENSEIPNQLTITNLDLHLKSPNKDAKIKLYAIAIKNNTFTAKQPDKWIWKFFQCLTAQQIHQKYGITTDHLPKSSRQMPQFLQQLKQKLTIHNDLIHNTDWININQISRKKRDKTKKNTKSKIPEITMTLSKAIWIKECEKAFQCKTKSLIPIVIKRQNKHWIEFVKIIHIHSQNIFVGIALKHQTIEGQLNNNCIITSIMLDRNDVLRKYTLTTKNSQEHIQQLKNFNTTITKIDWIEKQNPLDKKILALRKKIQNQQQSIQKLTLRNTRSPRHIKNQNTNNGMIPMTQLNATINSFISKNTTTNESLSEESEFIWIDSAIDQMTKQYEATIFQTNIVGAKSNIHIKKEFIETWRKKITKKFQNAAMMYFWLDFTISMQIIQRYAKTYIHKNNDKFIAVIVNTELHNKQNQQLYAIILLNEQINPNEQKYPYKLTSLMTEHEIKNEFHIYQSDLPQCSRKHPDFIKQLQSLPTINKIDIKEINWANVKTYPNRHNPNNSTQTTIFIEPIVLKNSIKAATQKMNPSQHQHSNKPQQPQYGLLPILTVDKSQPQYQIQWVLLTKIINKNSHIAISFKYNNDTDTFTTKGIFLTKSQIEIRHKVIGLKSNLANYLPEFSITKFKFKSTTDYKKQIIQYKNEIQHQRQVNQQLQQQIQQQNQLLVQQMQQFLIHQTQKHEQT